MSPNAAPAGIRNPGTGAGGASSLPEAATPQGLESLGGRYASGRGRGADEVRFCQLVQSNGVAPEALVKEDLTGRGACLDGVPHRRPGDKPAVQYAIWVPDQRP